MELPLGLSAKRGTMLAFDAAPKALYKIAYLTDGCHSFGRCTFSKIPGLHTSLEVA
jgi:hypothetical protein